MPKVYFKYSPGDYVNVNSPGYSIFQDEIQYCLYTEYGKYYRMKHRNSLDIFKEGELRLINEGNS